MKRWADFVSVSENHSQQGIELHFNLEPHPELQSKLRVKGFLPSKSQLMWYIKDTTESREFAEQVKNAFPVSQAGPELSLSSSYEPLRANIESKRFSYVLISLKDGQEKSYIVFEPSKPRAEVIAANFAWSEFGTTYNAIAVKPKTLVREARMLFDEGRIIDEVKYVPMQKLKQDGKTEIVPAPIGVKQIEVKQIKEKENEKLSSNKAPEETAKVITKSIGDDKLNPTIILNAFHKWLKVHPEHKDPQKVTRTVFEEWLKEHYSSVNERLTEDVWDRHKRLIKIIKRLGSLDTKMIVAQPYSSIYNKLLQIIPGLMDYLESGEYFHGKSKSEGYMDLNLDFVRKDKQGYIIALSHYYLHDPEDPISDLIADPDMEIRIIPEMKMAEAMTFQDLYRYDEVYEEKDGKQYVNLEMKKKLNTFLNGWLSNIIAQGHKIKPVKESEEKDAGEEREPPEEPSKEVSVETSKDASKEVSKEVSKITQVNIDSVLPIPETDIEAEDLYAEALAVQISSEDYNAIKLKLKQADTSAFYYEGTPYALNYVNSGYVMHVLASIAPQSFPTTDKDSPANQGDVYNEKTSGHSSEEIKVPMPEDCYEITLFIAKTNARDYRGGFLRYKKFGNQVSTISRPEEKSIAFKTHAEAIEETLAELLADCQQQEEGDLNYFDSKIDIKEKQERAIQALYSFAQTFGIKSETLLYKAKASLFHVIVAEVVPVPDLKAAASKHGMMHRISQSAYEQIQAKIKATGTEVWYYDTKAWHLVKTQVFCMERLPDLDSKVVKYYKGTYQKSEEYLHYKNIKERETDVSKLAFDRLMKLVPDLESRMQGEKTRATLEYEKWGEKKEVTCFFTPEQSSLFIVEYIEDEKHLESDILIELDKQEARVAAEWLSDYYAEGLGRLDPDGELEGDDMAIGEDMTRGLTEWLKDLLDEGLIIKSESKPAQGEHPLSFLNEPLTDSGFSGEITFNPVALATFIRTNRILIQSWKQSYRNDPLPVRNTYSTGEIRDLKDFYNTYILESSSEMENDYKSVMMSLHDTSFTLSDTSVKEPQTAAFKKRTYSAAEEKQILEDFKDFGFKAPFTAKEAFDKNLFTMDVALRYQHTEKFFKENFDIPIKKRVLELQKEVHKAGSEKEKANRSEHWQIGVKLLNAEKCYKDEFILFKDDFFEYVLLKAKEQGFYPKDNKDMRVFKQFIESTVFDEYIIEDYERKPISELIPELIADYFHAPAKQLNKDLNTGSGVIPYDIRHYARFVPNVLVPAGTKEPFWSADFYMYDMKELVKKDFPHLRKLTAKTLSKASAVEMFELVQMSHPSDYGIKVQRSAMLEEWEKRGKELFLGLGFPIDPDYPYVNINTGYDSVETLSEILWDGNKEGNEWWSVAEKNRPIADLGKALEFITREIESTKETMQNCVNPKTDKPRASQRDEYNQLKFNLAYFKKGKEAIEHYLKKSKAAQSKPKQADSKTREEKIPVDKIYLSTDKAIRFLSPQSCFIAGSWAEADKYVKGKIGKPSDIFYKIVWQDSQFLSGKMDVEPSENFKGKENILSSYLYRLTENVSKEDPKMHPTVTRQDVTEAKTALANYSFTDPSPSMVPIKKDHEAEIPELTGAYWQQADETYPVNKIKIGKSSFHQVRLRETLLAMLGKLPLTEQYSITDELTKKFPLKTTLEQRGKSLVTIGKTDKKREIAIIASFIQDMMIHYDLADKSNAPVCSYLINRLLTSKTSKPDDPERYGTISPKDAWVANLENIHFELGQSFCSVYLLKTHDGDYSFTLQCYKSFGPQREYFVGPNKEAPRYKTRGATIEAVLLLIKSLFEKDLVTEDKTFKDQDKKNNLVRNALKELEECAIENAVALNNEESSPAPTPIASELAPAYWNKEDNKYPINKAVIDGQTYEQSKLREVLIGLIKKMPMEQRLALAEDLSQRFTERRPMHEYMKDHMDGTGKFGKKTFTGAYYDDMIIDNDLKENSGWPVCKYLISVLVNKNKELVDQPIKEKPTLRKIAKVNQHELNKKIEALIDEKDKKGASFSGEEKELISQYAGSGGLIKQGASGRGVLYEYYTPEEIVRKMWGLAHKYGYSGGSVLEPSVGIGNFLKYAPKDAIVFGFETNHYAARIAQVLYPQAHIHEKPFESLFFAGNIHLKDKIDHPLDSLVIGNPPYGEFSGKYAGMGEKKWTGADEYDQYFMLRGLDLLQPGGLMVFIVPSQFLSNEHKYNKTKEKINSKAELLDAYRLPGRVFSATDIGTDIVVLRKRGGSILAANTLSGIDQEDLPMTDAKNSQYCSITGLFIKVGDDMFYDLEKPTFIKAVKIIGGDNPADLARKNPKLSSLLKKMFENFMIKNGNRNELREKYYGPDAIYDPSMAVDAALEYIHERMHDEGVSSCWLHKIDVTEAFED
jgi:uncharacterized protein YqiB (DUF1249 family)